MNESTAFAIRSILVEYAKVIQKKTDATNEEITKAAIGFPYYKQDVLHKVGEICRDPDTEQLKRCVTEYDGSVQSGWTIKDGTLWYSYHGISKWTAWPFVQPTGAHDQYKVGEFMTYTDGKIYEAIADTVYSPTDYPAHWKEVE